MLSTECSLIDKLISDLGLINYWWILLTLVLFMISNVIRSLRWNQLLRPLSHKPKLGNSFHATMLGYFANLGLPRSGEIIKAGALSRYEKIPMEKVIGTVVVDRAVDVLCLLVMIGLGLILQYQQILGFYLGEKDGIQERLGSLVVLGVIAMILCFIILLVLRKVQSIQKNRIVKKINQLIDGFWSGIISVKDLDRPFLFGFYSIAIWFIYYLMTYLAFFSFAPTANIPAAAGLVIFIMGGLGMVIPSPGGMGSYHYLIGLGFAIYGISEADSFTMSNIIFFSIQLLCVIIWGIIALIALPIINKNYKPIYSAT